MVDPTFQCQEWSDFIQKSCPGFITPSAYQFAGSLLNESYYEAMVQTMDKLKPEPSITLSLDEARIGHSPRVNFIACTPYPHFIVSKNAKNASITSTYLKQLIVEVLKETKIKIHAIISDNCSNIKSLRTFFEECAQFIPELEWAQSRFRCLSIYCLSHGVNLMMRDFIYLPFVKGKIVAAVGFCHKMNKNRELRALYSKFCSSFGINAYERFNVPPEIR